MDDTITRVTVVPDSRDIKDYRQGDIGQPLKLVDDRWILCCPMCGTMTTALHNALVTLHEDNTVSTVSPLHCHGRHAFRQYKIEHNRVRWEP